MPQANPQFIIAIAYINGDGEVIRFARADGTDIVEDDYDPGEDRRIPKGAKKNGAVLVTTNYCRWRLVGGNWKCVPA
jgi:hypothetical protein